MEAQVVYIILAALFGIFMAWGIGANDVANAMATSVGSKALTIKQAILVAAVFEFLGAVLAGGEVTSTIRKGIVDAGLLGDQPELLIYGATQEEVERFQLPCGGQLHVVIEPMLDKRNLEQLQQITERLAGRECIERLLDLGTGDFESKPRQQREDFICSQCWSNTNRPEEGFLPEDWCCSSIASI